MIRFHVMIPAAGSGNRMEAAIPKQYLPLNGKPIIAHSLQTFLACSRIASVHVAISPADTVWDSLPLHELTADARLYVHRSGGDARADTVLNTLAAMQSQVAEQDWVLVHDAARPGLTVSLLESMLDQLAADGVGGLLALPLADTLKRSDANNRIAATVPREALWQAQTPQMFRYALLKQALERFQGTPTDEAQAIEALGLQPKLVVGSLLNMKITYPQDTLMMEALLSSAANNSGNKLRKLT